MTARPHLAAALAEYVARARGEKPTVTAPAAAEPAVASWVAHPAPWLVPFPHQPIQLRAS